MIILESFEKIDFDDLISWVNNEEILMQFAGPIFTFPLTTLQLDEYLNDKNRLAFRIIDSSVKANIGHAEIYLPNETTAILCRIIIGNPAHRGQGIGQQIVNELLKICFIDLDVEKAELNVFDWNTGAIKCYEKVGFSTNVDKIKIRELKGKVWKALNMSINKTDWTGNIAKILT